MLHIQMPEDSDSKKLTSAESWLLAIALWIYAVVIAVALYRFVAGQITAVPVLILCAGVVMVLTSVRILKSKGYF